jgi:predicted RNA binding protein YcfA (HicA-like mRNA interferase family)
MSRPRKTFEKVMSGKSDANISYRDLCSLLEHLGFTSWTKGSHLHFERSDVVGIATLQPDSSKCKKYQVKQVRRLFIANPIIAEYFEESNNDED